MFRYWVICFLAILLAREGFAQNQTDSLSEDLFKPYFIIQKNNDYGLGNNGLWYTNTPVGDTIVHLKDRHFAVRQNHKLYKLYNEDFKLLHQNIEFFKEFDDRVFIKDSLGWKLFSTEDEAVSKYFDSIAIHQSYAWIFKGGKQGLIHLSSSWNNWIEPKYDQVGPYYDGVLLMSNGKLGWKGNDSLFIPVQYDHIYKEQLDVMAASDSRGTIYYSLLSNKRLQIEPSDSVVFYRNYYKRVRGKQQSIFNVTNSDLLEETKEFEIHPFSFASESTNNIYCVAVKDSMCALFRDGKLLTDFDYDNFLASSSISPPFFRVVKDNKVGIINANGQYQLNPLYNDVIEKNGNYYIVRIGNRLGLRYTGDSVILPASFQTVKLYNHKYAFVSENGYLFGIYNYITKTHITEMKYNEFSVDSVFIVARHASQHDVFHREILKFTDLYDVMANKNTVKGYKSGNIYMGYERKGLWEEYFYEIPSYKVVSENDRENNMRPFDFTDKLDVYDYSVGKWGNYSYNLQKWIGKPLVHSGDAPDGDWLLGFYRDTSIVWNGIHFKGRKMISPISNAWNAKSQYAWIDAQSHGYSVPNYRGSIFLSITPICYTTPGSGICFDNFKSSNVNAVFKGGDNKSVIYDNGKTVLANYGDFSLSEFITQISSNGSVHPQSFSDYQQLINPANRVAIKGATEHVLHRTNASKMISVGNSFDWIDKKNLNPVIFKQNNKFGALSDSSNYILKPEFESIETIKLWGKVISKVGVRTQGYKIYNPKTNQLSPFIENVLIAKDELLCIQLDDSSKAVINTLMDTLLKTTNVITLIGGSDYSLKNENATDVYRGKTKMFSFLGNSIEKINNEHFVIHAYDINYITNLNADTLFKSRKAIKYVALGNQYLLDDGLNYKLYDKMDKLIYQFQKQHYVINQHFDLMIKEENSVTVFQKDSCSKAVLKGKFVKATSKYIIVDLGKYKRIYDFKGKILLQKATNTKIINDDYVAFQSGKKCNLLNVETLQQVKVKSLNVNLYKEGIEYEADDESQQMLDFKAVDSLVIDEYRGKYGLKLGSKNILPYKYFQIEKLGEVYLVQDHIEYKLFDNYKRRLISNDSFDKVCPYLNYLMVVKKGKILYIDSYQGK